MLFGMFFFSQKKFKITWQTFLVQMKKQYCQTSRIMTKFQSLETGPHALLLKYVFFIEQSISNFCRNPDPENKVRPWCFVDTNLTWEYCQIPSCGKFIPSGHRF